MNTGNCRYLIAVFVFGGGHFSASNINTDRSGYNFLIETMPAGTIRASN